MKYILIILVLWVCFSHGSFASDRTIQLPVSFPEIVDSLAGRIPMEEKLAQSLPFLPEIQGCKRCTQPQFETKDGFIIRVLAFNLNKVINQVTIDILNNSKYRCIPLHYMSRKYGFTFDDGDRDGPAGGEKMILGYQKILGKSLMHFLAMVDENDKKPLMKECLAIFYINEPLLR